MNESQGSYGPLVTVVIPTYKRPEMLALALASVVGQRYSHLECIVVNDDYASREAVNRVVEGVGDPRFRVLHNEESLKGGGARNRGISSGKGEVVAFLDDDDQWLDSYLWEHVKVHGQQSGVGVVSSGVIIKWQQDVLPEKRLLMKPIPAGIDLRQGLLSGKVKVFTSSAFTVKRVALDKVGAFDKDLHSYEDWELCYRVSEYYGMANVGEALTIFYQHLNYRLTGDLESRKRGLEVLSQKVAGGEAFDQFRQKYLTQAYFTNIKNNALLGENARNRGLLRRYLQSNSRPISSVYKLKVMTKMLIIVLMGKLGMKITQKF